MAGTTVTKTGRSVAETRRRVVDPANLDYFFDVAKLAVVGEIVGTIERVREESGASKSELARRIEMHRSQLNQLLENDDSNPTIKTLLKLLWSLGLHADLTIREREAADERIIDVVSTVRGTPAVSELTRRPKA